MTGTKYLGTSNPNGQATSADSAPVVLASDQSTVPVSTASLPLPTGAAADSTLTGGTQQTKITDGTNVANTLKSDGTTAGQNSLMVTGSYLTSTWAATGSPVDTSSIDVGNYKYISVQITSYTSGSVIFQTSNDNTTWTTFALSSTSIPNSIVTSATTAGIFTGPIPGRYFRLHITGGGATNNGTIIFSTLPGEYLTDTVDSRQSGTWNIGSSSATGSAVPTNAFYAGVSDGTNLRGVTANSTTFTSKFAPDSNLLGTLGTAFTTAGKVDVKAATGDIVDITNGTQQTKITDGTNIANILKSDGTAAGQNAQIVSGAGMTTTTITLNSSTPNTVWFDMLNYSWWSCEVLTNTTPATLTPQVSGDPSQTQVAGTLFALSTASAFLLNTSSTNGNFHGPRSGRYFRISSNNGAGTTTLVLTFYSNASQFFTNTLNASSATIGNVGASSATGSAVPANAFYQGISDGTNLVGIKTASAASNTTGTGLLGAGALGFDGTNYQRLSVNTSGVQDVGLSPARTTLNTYSVHLTTNGTTTPTAATAYVSSIAISSEVIGTTSTVTIQDKQGTPLKLINGLSTTTLSTVPTVVSFQTPLKMVNGIDIVTAGAAAATVDVWINYYQ